jgi:hypothetical protein
VRSVGLEGEEGEKKKGTTGQRKLLKERGNGVAARIWETNTA